MDCCFGKVCCVIRICSICLSHVFTKVSVKNHVGINSYSIDYGHTYLAACPAVVKNTVIADFMFSITKYHSVEDRFCATWQIIASY